jgi:hypothetical protein
VSGFDTSGERGPSPSPCFGSHGAGVGGFCVLSGMLNTTDFQIGKQIKLSNLSGFSGLSGLSGWHGWRFNSAQEVPTGQPPVLKTNCRNLG